MSARIVSGVETRGSVTELMRLVEALDLDSADGRAGIKAILREIEAACPGAIEQMSARLQLGRLGWNRSAAP